MAAPLHDNDPWRHKPTYFAPEVKDHSFDQLTDVYSWGLFALQIMLGVDYLSVSLKMERWKREEGDSFKISNHYYCQLLQENQEYQQAATETLEPLIFCCFTGRENRIALPEALTRISELCQRYPSAPAE